MKKGHPRFYELLDEIRELHDSKNADYSKDGDPLSNFRLCGAFGIPPWKGALVRMSDKWSRITELAGDKPQKVADENITDTLMDLAVYALLTIILHEEVKEGDDGL